MANTENVSEKRKRGRPHKFSDETEATLRALGVLENDETRRTQTNKLHRQRALSYLLDDKAFSWLCDHDLMRDGLPGAYKPGILTELGRIEHPDDLKSIAAQVCELKPSTREAIAMIRRWRLGRDGEGNPIFLARELVTHINDYLKRYPNTTVRQIKAALIGVRDVYDPPEDDE